MKTFLNIVLLLSLSLNLTYCQTKQSNAKDGNKVNTVSSDEFEKMLGEEGVQLVDVRTPEEFNESRIKGAQNIDYKGDDFEKLLTNLDKNSPVLVYCLSGGRSADATDKMLSLGFKKIYNLDGGILKWTASNKPVESGENASASGGMTVEEFNKLINVNSYVLVDYSATWCGPCKKMLPVLEKIADKRKDKMKLVKIDVDENNTIARERKIDGIPYLELYQNGKLVWKNVGYISEYNLLHETGL